MCPGLLRSPGEVVGSDSARMVLHLSLADTPVLVLSLQGSPGVCCCGRMVLDIVTSYGCSQSAKVHDPDPVYLLSMCRFLPRCTAANGQPPASCTCYQAQVRLAPCTLLVCSRVQGEGQTWHPQ